MAIYLLVGTTNTRTIAEYKVNIISIQPRYNVTYVEMRYGNVQVRGTAI